MPPAFSTANQHAAIIGELKPRSSTRLPGTSPRSSRSTAAMRLDALHQSRYVHRPPSQTNAVRSAWPASAMRSSSSTAQFSRGGYVRSRQAGVVDDRQQLRRRQVVARKGVHVGGGLGVGTWVSIVAMGCGSRVGMGRMENVHGARKRRTAGVPERSGGGVDVDEAGGSGASGGAPPSPTLPHKLRGEGSFGREG